MSSLKSLFGKLDAFSSEILTNASILVGDSVWLTHDILTNGLSGSYFFIIMMFIIGFIGLYGSYKKHIKHQNKKKLYKEREAHRHDFII